MTPGPEHFTSIAHRAFPRLKEMTMTTDKPLDADEHYAAGERLRVCAEVASRENDFALAHDLRGRARLHYVAAQAACAIWPGRADDLPVAAEAAPAAAAGWVVARDGGRNCERCEQEVRRGEAYELEPGTGGLLHHIYCPDLDVREAVA